MSSDAAYSVTLKKLQKALSLELVTADDEDRLENILVTSPEVNRPGLQLVGYLEYFGTDRIQMIGKVETSYLAGLTSEERYSRLDEFFKCGFPCMVVARGLEVFPEMLEVSRKYGIPIFRTKETTSRVLSALISYLNVELAERTREHGVLVEVFGEGILILGESGVGKSETALELVKRGHRLVADDVVEIRRVSEKTLFGTAPDEIRHFIEIRGVGILDVKNLYGVGAVKPTENINLVIQLEFWDQKKDYERLGLVDDYKEILGINIPCLTIPVRPGRNLAIIVEVAALNNRQKKMGYNVARALNERIIGKGRMRPSYE